MGLALVQHAQGEANANTVTVTLSATGAGNALIVCCSTGALTGNETDLTSVTLGGSGTGFSSQASLTGTTPPTALSVWANYKIAGGQTSLVATAPSGQTPVTLDVYEVSGGLAGIDQSTSNYVNGTGAAWTSNATGTTKYPAEFWVGIMAGFNNGSGTPTITGPASPWTSEAQQNIVTGVFEMSGYQITSTAGAATFSGTSTLTGTNNYYAALVATFYTVSVTARSLVVSQAVNRASTY